MTDIKTSEIINEYVNVPEKFIPKKYQKIISFYKNLPETKLSEVTGILLRKK